MGLLAAATVERFVQGFTVCGRNLCPVDAASQCPQREVRMNSKSMAGWIGFAGLVMLILGRHQLLPRSDRSVRGRLLRRNADPVTSSST